MQAQRSLSAAALMLLLTACGGRGSAPADGSAPAEGSPGAAQDAAVVAEFEDRKLTVKDLNAYLDANLYLDDGVEGIPAEDLVVLQSRLFDSFVDESLLLYEAEKAGIEVSAEEVEAYVQANAGEEVEDAKSEALRREMGRRDLTIQKLRGTWVEANVEITPAEIAQFAAQHRVDLEPQKSLMLRSLMFGSEEEARTTGAAVASGRLTFEQAANAPGAAKGQAQPSKMSLESLPDEVRDAVENLDAGQVSKPVIVNGRPFLFYVVSWIKPLGDIEETVRERAEALLRREKQEDASRSQIDGARQRVPTKVYVENLPFRYEPAS